MNPLLLIKAALTYRNPLAALSSTWANIQAPATLQSPPCGATEESRKSLYYLRGRLTSSSLTVGRWRAQTFIHRASVIWRQIFYD